MTKYVYKQPKGKKYIISIRKWNKSFAKRGRWPFVRVEAYVSENVAEVQYLVSPIGKLTIILLLPIFILIGMIDSGLKKTLTVVYRQLFKKRTGSFSYDMVYRWQEESWSKLMKLIGEEV